uniref:Immunoglobulin domain-containing protein n=1 Tax=Cyprinus carpio carpio TaxID=630221 RepID=A0A8C1DXF0_CYPCA
MKHVFIFLLLCLREHDASAFQRDRMRRKSVMEGESVTLNSHVTNKQKDLMMWYFNDTLIAEITGDQSKICTDDQCEERFRDRLKLDHQTGSLTITHIKTTEAGEYKLQIMSSSRFSIMMSFSVTVTGIYSVGSDEVSVFVLEGDSVTLQTYVKTNQQEKIRWYFNGIQIAEITGDLKHICTDVQCKDSDGKFRDRLNLDHQTGSLTITNIKRTDYGLSELQVTHKRGRVSRKIFIVAVYGFSGVGSDGVSAFVMEEDSVTLYIDAKTNKSEDVPAAQRDQMKRKSVMEGESVTLDTGFIKNPNDLMTWYFNDILIAEITGDQSKICTDYECDERFRDRLKVNQQTGSLTIMNTRSTDSGLYELQINSSRISIIRRFSVTLFYGGSVSVKEGDSVTLPTDVKTNLQEKIRWYFNDFQIAEITGDLRHICTDVQCKDSDERFRDRLKLDNQTGSLTIMNIRTTDSGLYHLQISSIRGKISTKIFMVAVYGFSGVGSDGVSAFVMEEDSVTLYTDVETNQQKGVRWYFQYTFIAEISGDLSYICTDVQCDDSNERFRDRLKLDHQTGSLTIRNIKQTDHGIYELHIISSRRESNHQNFNRRMFLLLNEMK